MAGVLGALLGRRRVDGHAAYRIMLNARRGCGVRQRHGFSYKEVLGAGSTKA